VELQSSNASTRKSLYSEGKAIENASYFLLIGASRGCHFVLYLSEVRQWERITFVPPRSGHLSFGVFLQTITTIRMERIFGQHLKNLCWNASAVFSQVGSAIQ
jgi:hypothetical protein